MKDPGMGQKESRKRVSYDSLDSLKDSRELGRKGRSF